MGKHSHNVHHVYHFHHEEKISFQFSNIWFLQTKISIARTTLLQICLTFFSTWLLFMPSKPYIEFPYLRMMHKNVP